MSLPESRHSPTRRIDDVQLLQGLLTQRLYVGEQDRRLLRVLLAEAPRQQRTFPRASRRGARRLRARGAALALSGALALALASPLLPAVAASPQPATWIAVADRAADNLAPADQSDALLRALLNRTVTARQLAAPAGQAADNVSDALLRALLNRTVTARQGAAPAEQSDALLRALLNRTAASQAVAPAEQSDALLRALLNRTAASQAVAPAEQMPTLADQALAQAELTAGETLVIPAAAEAAAADANLAPLADTIYVVQPGDTLSGIAQAFYGNGNAWWGIFQANTDKIADPHWIYPNQQFVIPGAIYSASTTSTGGATTWVPNPAPNAHKGSPYTVVWGDTLSGIAYAAYGNGNNWWGIFQANTDKISNPDLIYPGQVLAIP